MSQGGPNNASGSGAPPIETLTGNSGGAVGPDAAFNVDVLGNNSSGIDVVGTPASNLLTIIGLQASETQRGTVELASAAETTTGTSTSLAVNPSGLNTKLGVQTSNGLIYGQGGAGTNLASLSAATDGQIPIGSTGNPPVLSLPTSTGSTITITPGGGTLNFDIASPLSVANGGTGNTSLTDHAVLIGSGTSPITAVGPVASTGAILASNGLGSDPGFTTATYPLTTTANEILYSSATNTVTGLTTANNSIVLTDGSGVPSLGTSLTNNFTFTNATAGTTRTLAVTHTDATGAAVSSAAVALTTQSGSSGDPFLRFDVNGGQDYSLGVDNSDSDSLKINDDVNPSTGNNLWKMTSSGERTMPLQPAFLAYLATSDANQTGMGTTFVLGDTDVGTTLTEVFDQNADFTPGASGGAFFTAPVTGRYRFEAKIRASGITAAMTLGVFRIVTSNRTYQSETNPGAVSSVNSTVDFSLSVLADMDANDTAQVSLRIDNGASNAADIDGSSTLITFFSGNLVC